MFEFILFDQLSKFCNYIRLATWRPSSWGVDLPTDNKSLIATDSSFELCFKNCDNDFPIPLASPITS